MRFVFWLTQQIGPTRTSTTRHLLYQEAIFPLLDLETTKQQLLQVCSNSDIRIYLYLFNYLTFAESGIKFVLESSILSFHNLKIVALSVPTLTNPSNLMNIYFTTSSSVHFRKTNFNGISKLSNWQKIFYFQIQDVPADGGNVSIFVSFFELHS